MWSGAERGETNLLTNWKTTLAGLAVGALQLFASNVDWKHILLAVGTATLGALAKDHSTQ